MTICAAPLVRVVLYYTECEGVDTPAAPAFFPANPPALSRSALSAGVASVPSEAIDTSGDIIRIGKLSGQRVCSSLGAFTPTCYILLGPAVVLEGRTRAEVIAPHFSSDPEPVSDRRPLAASTSCTFDNLQISPTVRFSSSPQLHIHSAFSSIGE